MAIVRPRADSKPRRADCWSAAGAASSTWTCTPKRAPVAGASGAERGFPAGGGIGLVVVVVEVEVEVDVVDVDVVVAAVWITSWGRWDFVFVSREAKTVS